MTRYLTRDGDMLDAICRRELGSEAHVAKTLDLNPGLAARGPIYAVGTVITLPDAPQLPLVTGTLRLWGRT